MSEEFKVVIEVEEEIEVSDKFSIEDKIRDALTEMGYTIIAVKVYW